MSAVINKQLMKNLIILFLLLIITVSAFAQKSNYGISFGIGQADAIQRKVAGGAAYDMTTSWSVALNYGFKLNDKVELRSGISLLTSELKQTSKEYLDTTETTYTKDFRMLTIPFLFDYNFSRHWSFDIGILSDCEISSSTLVARQNGLGFSADFAYSFSLSKKFSLQLIPYADMHNVASFNVSGVSYKIGDAGMKMMFRTN